MKRRILIIDGDTQLNKINAKVLQAEGLVENLEIRTTAEQALDYLRHQLLTNGPLPHLVVFDLSLPQMNGFEFLDELDAMDFAEKEQIILVVFTASSSPRDRQRALARGIRHYIQKPYLLRNIKDVIMRSPLLPPVPVAFVKGQPSARR